MGERTDNGTLIICTLATCPIDWAYVNYRPTIPGNAIYLALFGIALGAQTFLGIRHRTWGFLAGMLLGLLLEVLGYTGRILLQSNPFSFDYFLLYLIPLTIGPTLISASIYLCLARLIVAYSTRLSRFQPRTYTITFMSLDFLSLVFQSIGGGLTSTAETDAGADAGVNIMIAGLALQVFSLVVFMVLCLEFAWCVRRSKEARDERFEALRSEGKFRKFVYALAVATIAIFIRSTFRVVELSGGFDGELANDQVTFMLLEGPMILIAAAAMTVYHPGVAFHGQWAEAGWNLRNKKKTELDG